MHVTAVRRQTRQSGERGRVVTLFVRNISDGGVCCISPEPIGDDAELMLFIPPCGGRGGRDVRCDVVGEQHVEQGWRVHLAFRDPRREAERLLQ